MSIAVALRPTPSRIAPSVVPGLDLYAGRFDAVCSVCGRRPCTLLLQEWTPADGPGRSPGRLAQYFYCPAHEEAADPQYEALAFA